MRTMTLRPRLLAGSLLALAAAGVAAQGVPRDDYPLPPGTRIAPLGEDAATDVAAEARTGGFDDLQKAREALDELLRAYESGNVSLIQRRLDPAMVGYQVFLDGVRRDVNAYKNLRINLTDTQITAGPDLAVIQVAWEKRFVSSSSFTPGLFTGRSTILMHRDGEHWRLAAVARDNPFSSASGTLARLTITPMMIGVNDWDGTIPLRVEVTDPDMAGLANVRITVTSNAGERETLVLPSVSPGVFRILAVDGFFTSVTPNNQLLEASPDVGSNVFTFRYVDSNPGENRPPSTLTRTLRVQ